MPKIIINRSSEWNNRIQDVGIYLNENKIGTISNGETKVFKVKSGQHSLRAKINWCRSNTMTFNLDEKEVQKVSLSGFKLSKWLMPIGLVFMIFYLMFDEVLHINPIILFAVIIPIFCYLLYHFDLRS